jgi:hypothetical protein
MPLLFFRGIRELSLFVSLPLMPAASTIERSFSLRMLQRCACLSSFHSLICKLRFSCRQMSTGHLVLLSQNCTYSLFVSTGFCSLDFVRLVRQNVHRTFLCSKPFSACLTANHASAGSAHRLATC